jgi:hypothetical protein
MYRKLILWRTLSVPKEEVEATHRKLLFKTTFFCTYLYCYKSDVIKNKFRYPNFIILKLKFHPSHGGSVLDACVDCRMIEWVSVKSLLHTILSTLPITLYYNILFLISLLHKIHTLRTPLIRINWDFEPTGYAENSDFSLKIGYIGSLNFGCCYSQHVPASKPFDHAWFEVLEAITL